MSDRFHSSRTRHSSPNAYTSNKRNCSGLMRRFRSGHAQLSGERDCNAHHAKSLTLLSLLFVMTVMVAATITRCCLSRAMPRTAAAASKREEEQQQHERESSMSVNCGLECQCTQSPFPFSSSFNRHHDYYTSRQTSLCRPFLHSVLVGCSQPVGWGGARWVTETQTRSRWRRHAWLEESVVIVCVSIMSVIRNCPEIHPGFIECCPAFFSSFGFVLAAELIDRRSLASLE